MHPSIAVVVTCYNKGPWVEAALASLAAQVTAPHDVVFVDDGSTDDSVARAEAFAASHPALPLRILRQPNSGQPAHARNAGIATVTSDVVICLDADDVLSPLHLEAVAHAFAADPGLGLVYPDGIAFGQGAPRGWQSQEWDPARLAQTNLCPCVTAFRRRIWETVGGYRTNVRGYEDWDFWIAAGAIGERGLRLPLPLFHYRELESGVFASTHARDLVLRASIVLNNPGCYGEPTRALARAIVDGAPFDPMPVWRELDEILRVGCVTAAMAAAASTLAWAEARVADGTAAAEQARLVARVPADAEATRRVGALLVATGDATRGKALLVLAWSATMRATAAPAAPSAAAAVAVPAPAAPPTATGATALTITGRPATIAPPLAEAASRPRVLCWMPYGQWALHQMHEMTILQGARWRGAEVRYVLCDGAFRACDMHWAAVRPREATSCATCRKVQHAHADGLRMPHEWLGDHVTPLERSSAAEWAASLPVGELTTARWHDWEIGAWIRSSVHSHHRTNHLDPADPSHEWALRAYLEAGLLTAFAVHRLLETWRPDVFLLFNGRQAVLRVALELARAAGVRTVTHERGWRKETLYLAENADCLTLAPTREAWRAWRDVPLTAAEHARVAEWLQDRAHGRNLNWRAFTPPPGEREATRRALGLRDGAPMVVCFTSSEDEYIACPDYASAFGSQERWLEATLAWAADRPDVDVVVRVHPNTGSRVSSGSNVAQLAWLHALAERAPATVRFLWPDDTTSSYTLMDLATVGAAFVSTVSLELACRGGATIAAAQSRFSGNGFTEDVDDPARYGALLDRLVAEPDADAAHARTVMAWRFAYYILFRYMLPFPLVQQPGPHDAALAYGTLEALAPGRDAGVDAATAILLDGRAVCPPPAPHDRADPARDAAAEAARLAPRALAAA